MKTYRSSKLSMRAAIYRHCGHAMCLPAAGLLHRRRDQYNHPVVVATQPLEIKGGPMGKLALLAICLIVTGCAVPLTPEAEKVQLVTAAQKDRCQPIKLITATQKLGPNKPGNALKSALNETAEAGGNGLYVVSSLNDWADGASVIGEALRCK